MGQLLSWETYRKRGRGWQYLGTRQAETMRGAALATGYVHHIRVVAVRPEDSRDKLYVFRFKYTPEVHHGR